MNAVLEAPAVELLPITPAPSLVCESCEINQAAVLVVLPRQDDDDGGRPRFVVCSPCASVAT